MKWVWLLVILEIIYETLGEKKGADESRRRFWKGRKMLALVMGG
jgi:hypothetical protein